MAVAATGVSSLSVARRERGWLAAAPGQLRQHPLAQQGLRCRRLYCLLCCVPAEARSKESPASAAEAQ